MRNRFALIIAFSGLLFCSKNIEANDFIIDSTRMGDIRLCDKISDIAKIYPNTKPLKFEGDEGVSWKGLKIMLSNNKWIIIEASWVDPDRIWRITTNSIKYNTVNGYKVGDKISKLKNSPARISYFESEMGFELISKKLNFSFSIESNYTEDFYNKVSTCKNCSDFTKLLPDEASIQEIIISGKCK